MPIIRYPELVYQPFSSDPKFINLCDLRFDRLTIIGYAGGREWYLACDCGSLTRMLASNFKSRKQVSCGCFHREWTVKNKSTHGYATKGKVKSEYRIYNGMMQRCLNPKHTAFDNYGGRGITICPRWIISFANFIEDMGERPSLDYTLDRKDNNLGYSKENCQWATKKDQGRNKRNNKLITYKDRTQCLSSWAEELGIKTTCLSERLKRMTIEQAFSLGTS